MRVLLTERFARAFAAAPPEVQKSFGKQLAHLLGDMRHRSLDAKKYPESGDLDLWQARANGGWRFYFHIETNTYVIESIRSHPKR
jgi:hypothetical protein